ncbi:MAG: hypothetical protein AB1453_15895, partial [Chloroflexota bacterium]
LVMVTAMIDLFARSLGDFWRVAVLFVVNIALLAVADLLIRRYQAEKQKKRRIVKSPPGAAQALPAASEGGTSQ